MSGRRGRGLADEERVLWTAVTQSIAPLKRGRGRVASDDAAAPAPPPSRKAVTAAPRAAAVAKSVPPAPPLTPLDRRLKKRVAKGRDAIDGRLDLHGLTQAEAHAVLTRFLNAAAAREARLVLVITGKGRSDRAGSGVLRRQVPLWLALPELRALVIGFEPAHVAHGGDGALYVRLRRTRSFTG